jgi:proteasome lid subunit RPN8/RPN11
VSARRLVIEEREDGAPHVVSVPRVGWRLIDAPPPEPTPQETQDEIRLALADARLIEPPLITYGNDGEPRLDWPDDLERLWRPIVDALAPEIRRERRLRRARRVRARKPPTPAEGPKSEGVRPRVVEVEQQSDGRWQPVSSEAGEADTPVEQPSLRVPAEVVARVREHALAVHQAQHGFESLGVLVCDGDRVLRYTRLHNPSRRAGEFGLDSRRLNRRELATLPVHSHPVSVCEPSSADEQGARWPISAIYSLLDGRLRVWSSATTPWREIAVEIAS